MKYYDWIVYYIFKVLSKNILEESWSKISKQERLSDQSEEPSILIDASDSVEKQYERQDFSEEQKSSALCEYERILHTGIFLPAWKSMKVTSLRD